MKYIKLFFECIGLFILAIPICFINLAMFERVSLNPSKDDWKQIIILSFISVLTVFLFGVKDIRKKNKVDLNVKKEEEIDVEKNKIIFRFSFSDQRLEDTLYLYKDESIVSSKLGDWDLYFDNFKSGLSICKKNGRVINFIGYSSNFYPIDKIDIPVSQKGAVYVSTVFKGDGVYYPEEYGFKPDGFYDVNTGWYRVGDDFLSGEVIEISINTLINLEDGRIKAIYFKPQIAKE